MTERAHEIKTLIQRAPWIVGCPTLLCALSLAGCASNQTALPSPTPFPTVAPTSTPDIGFAVVVTPVGLPTTTATPAPTSTPFSVPRGPYIQLIPSTGPPISRRVIVRGGHLPPAVGLRLGWSKDGRAAPVTTAAGTDKRGNLLTQFTVPASPPGTYHVVLIIGGVRYASAPYVVTSAATLVAHATTQTDGERLNVRGAGFVPSLKLLLVAYPIDERGKPVIVGTLQCRSDGSFKYARTVRSLPLGQYLLKAWSNDAMTAQMAETYFQVVI